jgi:hypothetical protein
VGTTSGSGPLSPVWLRYSSCSVGSCKQREQQGSQWHVCCSAVELKQQQQQKQHPGTPCSVLRDRVLAGEVKHAM